MAAQCEHAFQVVDILFELGHSDHDTEGARQIRAQAGLSSGHDA